MKFQVKTCPEKDMLLHAGRQTDR